MHGGAEAACVNVLLTDAGEDQLIPTSAYQVEAHSALAWCHEPTVDQVALVSSGGEGIDEIRADFIAAGTDRGAHRHDQVLGLTAELALHFVDCCHRDARRGSAPARMNGGIGTGARVGDEQRDAIGGAHDKRNIWRRRNNRIRYRTLLLHCFERLARNVCVDKDDVATVDLVQRHDASRRDVDGRRERAPCIRGRQLELSRCKQMLRKRLQWPAAEGRAPRLIAPVEARGNRWKRHVGSEAGMQIIGVGLDATEIERVADMIERYGERFLRRIFTDGEIGYCQAKRDFASSYAARFAAKEAAMKALGTGHSRGVYWTGIEVVRRHGPPRLAFHGGADERFKAMGGTSSLLTLTHSRELAIAHVMLMKE